MAYPDAQMRICEQAAACIAVELVLDLSYLQRCNMDVYHVLHLGGNIEPIWVATSNPFRWQHRTHHSHPLCN